MPKTKEFKTFEVDMFHFIKTLSGLGEKVETKRKKINGRFYVSAPVALEGKQVLLIARGGIL
jgi:hypothetical protein